MSFNLARTFLYAFLFMFSVALMGLTAYRIRYTKSKSGPDVLTTRTHFYTPIVVELLTVGILGTLWSLYMLRALLAKVGRGPLGTYLFELLSLGVLSIMSLIGAAIFTHDFENLGWCRDFKVCRILEAIKAFSWIFWIWTVILMLTTLANMWRNGHSFTGPLHGFRDTEGSYPQARTGPVHQEFRTVPGARAGTARAAPIHEELTAVPGARTVPVREELIAVPGQGTAENSRL